MANYIAKCQGCGAYGPFLIREEDLRQAESPGPVERYCSTCKQNTLWSVTFPDRRVADNLQSGIRRRSTDV